MNPALVLTCNNLELTKKCVESLRWQDIETSVFIVDNGSTDGTVEWCRVEEIPCMLMETNTGFSHGMNKGLDWVFRAMGAEWCLCPNNDTILPPYYYRLLLDQDMPVVSGVQHVNGHRVTLEDLKMDPPIEPVRPNPDFSALLFRREAWEALGGFDERLWSYASDCDMHIRAHLKGIVMNHVHVPFFHEGSATIRHGDRQEKARIESHDDVGVFQSIWGCTPGSPEYDALFAPELFGVKAH